MSTVRFSNFKKLYGAPSDCRLVPADTVEAFKHQIPPSLLEEWRTAGWCSYGNGFVWFTNPSEFTFLLKNWSGVSPSAHVFARSAFGHLFLWHKNEAFMLDPEYGTIAQLIDDLDLVFNHSLCSKPYLNSVLGHKLFSKAVKSLGAPAFDECYGFEPAIALGGTGTLDTVKRVKLREHLAILAGLTPTLKNV